MKNPLRPFLARVPKDDAFRVAIAKALDANKSLEMKNISQNILGKNHAYLYQFLIKGSPKNIDLKDAIKLVNGLSLAKTLIPKQPVSSLSLDQIAKSIAFSELSEKGRSTCSWPEDWGKKEIASLRERAIYMKNILSL